LIAAVAELLNSLSKFEDEDVCDEELDNEDDKSISDDNDAVDDDDDEVDDVCDCNWSAAALHCHLAIAVRL
jgi:hypothetical protein